MFLMATVAVCMSLSGLPQPPWLTCEHIQSPVVRFNPAGIRPGEDMSYALGRQCRMAIHDNTSRSPSGRERT